MAYTNKIERQFIDEGINIILNGHCILSLALDPTKSPEDVEYRKRVFPELAAWMRKVKECEYLSNTMTVESPVKAYAIKRLLELREAHKPKTTIKNAMKAVAKPVLKVKKVNKVNKERNDWKARAIKAETELTNSNNQIKSLEKGLARLKEENDTLKTIAKQSVLNNIQIMKAVGIEVTQQDLDL